MRGARFRWRYRQQKDQFDGLRAVNALPRQRFAERRHGEGGLFHRLTFTMRHRQAFAQRRRPQRFPMENLAKIGVDIGDFSLLSQPLGKLTDRVVTIGESRMETDRTGVGQGRQVHHDPHRMVVITCGHCRRQNNTFT